VGAASAAGAAGTGGLRGAEPKPGEVALVYRIGKGAAVCENEATFRKWVAAKMHGDPFVLTGQPSGTATQTPAGTGTQTRAGTVTQTPGTETQKPAGTGTQTPAGTGTQTPAGAVTAAPGPMPTHVLTVRLEWEAPGFRGVAELRDAKGGVVMVRETLERTCAAAVDRMVVVVLLSVFPPRPPPAPASPAPPAPPVCGPCDDALRKETNARRAEVETERDARRAEIDELRRKLEAVGNDLQAPRRKGYGRGMDLTFALSTGALITGNLTSNVGPGVWFGAEAGSGPIVLGLELRAVLPSPVSVPPYDFDFSQMGALLTPCGRYSYFFGCVVAGAGVQISHDSNYDTPSGPTLFLPLVQIGGRAGVEVPFGDSPFAGRAWGEVLYSTPGAGVFYDGSGKFWIRPDVSVFVGLGIVYKFGDAGAR